MVLHYSTARVALLAFHVGIVSVARVHKEGEMSTRKGIKRVYIAGKLSDSGNTERSPSKVVCDYIQNLSEMCACADGLVVNGYAPYVPGLDFLVGLKADFWKEEDYRSLSMAFLEVCDAVLVISESKGVEAEIKRAGELGIPVYYRISDLWALEAE